MAVLELDARERVCLQLDAPLQQHPFGPQEQPDAVAELCTQGAAQSVELSFAARAAAALHSQRAVLQDVVALPVLAELQKRRTVQLPLRAAVAVLPDAAERELEARALRPQEQASPPAVPAQELVSP